MSSLGKSKIIRLKSSNLINQNRFSSNKYHKILDRPGSLEVKQNSIEETESTLDDKIQRNTPSVPTSTLLPIRKGLDFSENDYPSSCAGEKLKVNYCVNDENYSSSDLDLKGLSESEINIDTRTTTIHHEYATLIGKLKYKQAIGNFCSFKLGESIENLRNGSLDLEGIIENLSLIQNILDGTVKYFPNPDEKRNFPLEKNDGTIELPNIPCSRVNRC